jgi:hypothetical protein
LLAPDLEKHLEALASRREDIGIRCVGKRRRGWGAGRRAGRQAGRERKRERGRGLGTDEAYSRARTHTNKHMDALLKIVIENQEPLTQKYAAPSSGNGWSRSSWMSGSIAKLKWSLPSPPPPSPLPSSPWRPRSHAAALGYGQGWSLLHCFSSPSASSRRL